MHDGIFRKRDLSRDERKLVACLEAPQVASEQDLHDALRAIVAKSCWLPDWLLPAALPDDLFPRSAVLVRIERQSPSVFVNAVGEYLEASHWEHQTYPRVLQDAVSCALKRDLVRVAGSIAFADRMSHRPPQFVRNVEVSCRVECVDAWTNDALQQALSRCLKTLTQDNWRFSFRAVASLQRLPSVNLALALDAAPFVIPYSDGLDSFAARTLVESSTNAKPVCATVLMQPGTHFRIRKTSQPMQWVRAWFRPGCGNHAEPSFRSRGFLFLAVAAIVARTRSCKEILIRVAGVDSRPCGVCPNCLLRRVTLINAGLAEIESQESYIWRDLSAPTLRDAVAGDLKEFCVTPRHCEIARGAVLVHNDLAGLAGSRPSEDMALQVSQVAAALGRPVIETAAHATRLLQKHKQEWEHFLECRVSPDSWLRILCQ